MSKRDSSTGRFASAQQSINDERAADLFGIKFDEIDMSIGRIAGYLVGSMVWGYALGCVAGVAIDALFLLSIPLVFQVIASLVVAFLAVYLAVLGGFAFGVYATEGTIWVANKVVSGAKYVKEKFTQDDSVLSRFKRGEPIFGDRIVVTTH
jgi:hypothetical protein